MAGWHHQCNGYELGQTGEMVRDREAWHAAVHGVVKRWTGKLNNNMLHKYIPEKVSHKNQIFWFSFYISDDWDNFS